jgi:hypothetical protein
MFGQAKGGLWYCPVVIHERAALVEAFASGRGVTVQLQPLR